MDLITLGASNSYTYEKIKEIETGISSVVTSGDKLIFTLANGKTVECTISGFSDENYTTADKTKLASLDDNILNGFVYMNGDLYYKGTQLLLRGDEQGVLNYNELINLPSINGVIMEGDKTIEELGLVGSEEITNYYKKTETYNQIEINSKLDDKISKDGTKQLSEENFTTIYKNKLESLENLSMDGYATEVYVDNKLSQLPLQDLSSYEKILDNDAKLLDKADKVHTHEISTINGLSDEFVKYYLKTETYNQIEINELIANVVKSMNWKESKDTQDDLPLIDNMDSDVRITKSDNMLNMWIEAENKWIQLISMNNINLVTSTLDGLMSKEDKIKLDNIIIDNLVTLSKLNEELNKKSDLSHTHINYVEKENGKSLIEDSKIAKIDELMSIEVPTKTSDLANDSGYINNDNLDEYLKLNSLLAGDNIEITNDENGTVTIKSTASGLTEEQTTKISKINIEGDGSKILTDNGEYVDLISEINNTHTNKDVLDGITSDLITNWNNAVTHIPDTIKHITSDERALWNTVSNKAENSHIHDDMYYTESEIDDKLKNYTTENEVEEIKKQVLENNHISIETDSVLTKLDSVKDGFVDNLVIGGKTLQNLNVKRNGIISKTFTNTTGEIDRFSNFHLLLDDIQLKPNTVYTYVVDATIWDDNIKLIFGETLSTETSKFTQKINLTNKIGRQIFTNRTKTDFSNAVLSDRSFVSAEIGISGSISFTYMILEGDWTNKEIPPYFEGIKSAGEDENNLISVKTCGKNLFNSNNPILYNVTNTQNDGVIRLTNTGTWGSLKQNIYLLSGTYNMKLNYKVVSGNDRVLLSVKKGDTIVKENSGGELTFTINSNGYYNVSVIISNDNTETNVVELSDIQLEKNDVITEYEPYIEDKTEILLNEPLRGLPNGICDTIDYEKGIITRNVGKVILNGSENWLLNTGYLAGDDYIGFDCYINAENSFISRNSLNCISDKFPSFIREETQTFIGEVGVTSFERCVCIKILKSKLSSTDTSGFKAWLNANQITLYYQLATPTIESIDNKSTLQTFKDGNIRLENSITPIVDLDYSVSIPNVLSRHNKEIDELIDGVNNLTESVANNTQAIANNTVQLNDMVNNEKTLFEGDVFINGTIITLADNIYNYKNLKFIIEATGNVTVFSHSQLVNFVLRSINLVNNSTDSSLYTFELNMVKIGANQLQIDQNFTMIVDGQGVRRKFEATPDTTNVTFIKILKIIGMK